MKRREFLKAVGLGAAHLAVPTLSCNAQGRPSKPNIILVLADDLGWAELGCYGNAFNETPNLDGLAEKGMRFTQAYAAAPVCSPTRAALMTGQYPARIGITDYLRPNDRKHLSPEHITIAEALKRAGYATGIIGKWHLTGYANHGAQELPPSAHGFDEIIVSENRGIGGGSYFHPYHFNREIEKRLPGREHLIDRMNVEATEFIRRHRDRPFFLYLSHYAVHTTLQGKEELVARLEKKPNAGRGNTAARNNPHLAAQLKSIDEGIGMIMRTLHQLGLADRTALVFTSDNGGESRVTSNAPLRAGKSTLYEGGIRVPLIVHHPGFVAAGTVCNTPVSTIDFYPTFCQITGTKPDPQQGIDGVSVMPLLRNAEAKLDRDALYWHYPLLEPHFLGGRSSGAIRQGEWKLIRFFDTSNSELYDLYNDIGETENLAASQPQKVRQLEEALTNWQHRMGCSTRP